MKNREKQRKIEESATYTGAVGWWRCLGDEPPAPCSTLSGWGRFEPAPCSRVEGLVSLVSKGAVAEPPLSVATSGVAVDPPTPSSHVARHQSRPPPLAPQAQRQIRLPPSTGPPPAPQARWLIHPFPSVLRMGRWFGSSLLASWTQFPHMEQEGSLRGRVGAC